MTFDDISLLMSGPTESHTVWEPCSPQREQTEGKPFFLLCFIHLWFARMVPARHRVTLLCCQASGMYSMDAVQAMAFDGCFHDTDVDMDLTPFPEPCEENETRTSQTNVSNADTPRLKRKRSLKGNVGRIILQNNHVIDTYSRIIFPSVYIVFNFFYWGLYIWTKMLINGTLFILQK